jgi:hypothetical protein
MPSKPRSDPLVPFLLVFLCAPVVGNSLPFLVLCVLLIIQHEPSHPAWNSTVVDVFARDVAMMNKLIHRENRRDECRTVILHRPTQCVTMESDCRGRWMPRTEAKTGLRRSNFSDSESLMEPFAILANQAFAFLTLAQRRRCAAAILALEGTRLVPSARLAVKEGSVCTLHWS